MVFLWQALAKRVAEERTVDLTGEIEILDIEKRRAISISDVNKRIFRYADKDAENKAAEEKTVP